MNRKNMTFYPNTGRVVSLLCVLFGGGDPSYAECIRLLEDVITVFECNSLSSIL